jgi:hypothetical protein
MDKMTILMEKMALPNLPPQVRHPMLEKFLKFLLPLRRWWLFEVSQNLNEISAILQ